MTSDQIRQQFIAFFQARGHSIVPSSLVVPHDDPTLLFTNAGMNQFKPIFLGHRAADVDKWQGVVPGMATRAANSQKCIRAGGKHNDLDDVGKDTYHHTFFEMLGNWSFGDYFKKEAIAWAWELLTEVWGIPKERLHATYFGGSGRGAVVTNQEVGRLSEPPSAHYGAPTRFEAAPEAPRGGEPSRRDSDTAFESLPPDIESRDLWLSVTDIDPAHVHPGSMKDNFWEMGDTGPCGPCSEIHIDLTPDGSGGPLVNAGDARVMEIWNLVFIQFNRGSDGKLTPLPAKHVDTGMGFERLCSVLQGLAAGKLGRFTNYDTDVFTPIFEAIRKRTGAAAYGGLVNRESPIANHDVDPQSPIPDPRSPIPDSRSPIPDPRSLMIDVSYRVIADHLRALTFAITDGAIPSNEGRGFVLRRILRRAVRFGRQYLNVHEPFMCDLVEPLVAHMGGAFPELRRAHAGKNVAHVIDIIRDEEASFLKTLDRGMKLFEEAAERAIPYRARQQADSSAPAEQNPLPHGRGTDASPNPYRARQQAGSSAPAEQNPLPHGRGTERGVISGEDAFRLHDTYGFPIDLTQQMAEERGLTVDIAEYERLMEEARRVARTRGSTRGHTPTAFPPEIIGALPLTNESYKYETITMEYATVLALLRFDPDGKVVRVGSSESLYKSCYGAVVLDESCFYAEQGGQVSDIGVIATDDEEVDQFIVEDTIRVGDAILHIGLMRRGAFGDSEPVHMRVDARRRESITQNHTATHLLNWALREALCPPEERVQPHVQQKGSLVDAEKTRFDFSHNKPLSEEDIERIEGYVAMQIRANHVVYTDEVDQAAARQINTLRAVFGEKYPERVRVVSIGAPILATGAAKRAPSTGERVVANASPPPARSQEEGGARAARASQSAAPGGVPNGASAGAPNGASAGAPNGVEEGEARMAEEGGAAAMQLEEHIHKDSLLESPADPKWMQYSVEFCGGTHVQRTGEIMDFALVSEEAVAKGVRRVVGVTAQAAREARARAAALRDKVVALWDAPEAEFHARLLEAQKEFADAVIPVLDRHKIREQLEQLADKAKKLEKQKAAASGGAVLDRVAEIFAMAEAIAGVTVIVAEVPPASPDALRAAVDWVRQKTQASAVLLAFASDGKVTLLAGMSDAVVKKGVKAGDLIKEIAPLVGGKGGGRPDLAQGGGTDAAGLPKALEAASAWLKGKLA